MKSRILAPRLVPILSAIFAVGAVAGDPFPPARTLAEADRARCRDDAGLIAVIQKWDERILALPGVSAVGMNLAGASENHFREDCIFLEVKVEKKKNLRRAKRALGESFEGYLVRYAVGGTVRAAPATAAPAVSSGSGKKAPSPKKVPLHKRIPARPAMF